MKLSSRNISSDVYHGVPIGWSKKDIIALHQQLHGKYSIITPEPENVTAPSYIPDRFSWLEYRDTLYKVGDGISAGDNACIEIAINYIELNYFGSYSGFIRERFARLLKNQEFSKQQAIRLQNHFKSLIDEQCCLQEFRLYSKLNKRIMERFGAKNT